MGVHFWWLLTQAQYELTRRILEKRKAIQSKTNPEVVKAGAYSSDELLTMSVNFLHVLTCPPTKHFWAHFEPQMGWLHTSVLSIPTTHNAFYKGVKNITSNVA